MSAGSAASCAVGVGVLACLLPTSARAQPTADIGPVIAVACAANVRDEQLRERLAQALLNEAGVLGSDILADQTLTGTTLGQRAVAAVGRGTVAGVGDPQLLIPRLRQRLEQYLGANSNVADRKLVVVDPPAGTRWLFDPMRSVSIECAKPKPAKPIITQLETPQPRPQVVIREKVEELALTGEGAKKAGAAKVGFSRVRTQKDDGSFKTVTTWTASATLGIRLTPLSSPLPSYAYANYSLSRARTKPVADPSKKQSDGDVSALETGLSLNTLHTNKGFSWVATLQGGLVSDFSHDARRLKGRITATPGFAGNLRPLCDVGGFGEAHLVGLRFRTRCTLTFEAEASHVLKVGTADFKKHGDFFGLGGTAGYQIAAPIGDKAAVLGTISYRYLPTLIGHAPDIKRRDASIKYRFWLDSGPGIDLGLTWANGTNPLTYTEEDKLELGFGLVM